MFMKTHTRPRQCCQFSFVTARQTPLGWAQPFMLEEQLVLCPVAAVSAYLTVRRQVPGPLYIYEDGIPLSRPRLVRNALSVTGASLSQYSGHSFRIGAATTAAEAGFSDSLIKTLGRWRSSALQRYIRTSRRLALASGPIAGGECHWKWTLLYLSLLPITMKNPPKHTV